LLYVFRFRAILVRHEHQGLQLIWNQQARIKVLVESNQDRMWYC